MISERLEKLPLGGFHKKLLLLSGFGWLFDSMDVGIISFALVSIGAQWKLSDSERGIVISMGLLGMFAGAVISGRLADRFGRKRIFLSTLVIFSLSTGLCGLASGLSSMLLFRFCAGFGLGGALPVASAYVSEFSPARYRGRLLVLLESFWAYGWFFAALVSFLLIPKYGWRVAFLVGALPAFYAIVLHRFLPESPRFLVSSGKEKEAEATVSSIERSLGVTFDGKVGESHEPRPFPFSELWKGIFLRRTLCLWILWFCIVFGYYGIFTWLPSFLVKGGLTLVKSFEYTLIITAAQIPGYFSAAYLVDRVGRKWVLAFYLACTALSAYYFGISKTPSEILFWGSVISFFCLGAWGVVYTYTPELYPTRGRGTGSGAAAGFGRIGGIIAPYLVGAFIGYGFKIIFGLFAVVLLIAAADVAILGEETRGKTLEEISG